MFGGSPAVWNTERITWKDGLRGFWCIVRYSSRAKQSEKAASAQIQERQRSVSADGAPVAYAEIITGTPRLALQLPSMCQGMAVGTKGYQVFFRVASRMASELNVVNLQMLHAATKLAAPAIALQHTAMQLAVTLPVESHSRVLGRWDSHEAGYVMADKNVSCCDLGRNW